MSLQNLQAVLLSSDELGRDSSWISKLGIANEDIEIVKVFLQRSLSSLQRHVDQY